jgi:MoxR-like ATPase
MMVLEENNPRLVLMSYMNLRRQLKNLGPRTRIERRLEEFELPEAVYVYLERRTYKERTLVLSGEAGTGKTEASYAILRDIMRKEGIEGQVLAIRHIDQLREYRPEYKALLIDDVSVVKLTREDLLNLFDVENEGQVHARYQTGEIPKGMPRIMTTNYARYDVTQEDAALERRICWVTIEKTLFKYSKKEALSRRKEGSYYADEGGITLPNPHSGCSGNEGEEGTS